MAQCAQFLQSADHRTILAAGFECVVPGLRRALAKSGFQPHEPDYYARLYGALAFGPLHVVRSIMQAESLDPERLAVIEMMPKDLCDTRILGRVAGRFEATDLVLVTDFLAARGVDRGEFVAGLRRSKGEIKKVVRRWSLKIPFPPHPIPGATNYRPIRNGAELREAALKYQNCSRRYIVDSVTGEHAFGEFTSSDGQKVLICLEKLDGDWMLDGVYGPRNRRVPSETDRQARELAFCSGIASRRRKEPADDAVEALRRYSSTVFDW
jgi:hypothetical protein